MVIQFSIGNYRSFNEIQTINFRATGLVSEDKTVDENNIAVVEGQKLLKTIGVYGANASGKSNLVKGFSFFKNLIVTSLSRYGLIERYINPFKQSKFNNDNSGYFQVILLLEGKKYRYGFTLNPTGIDTEWLFGPAEKNETFYFTRKGKVINVNKEIFLEGFNIPYETKLRQDVLFLTFCSSYNGYISSLIVEYFNQKVGDLSIEERDPFKNLATNTLVTEGKKEVVLKWLREAGLTFNNLDIRDMGDIVTYDENGPYEIYSEGYVELYKNIYGLNGEIVGSVKVDMISDESEGTQKYYSFIGKLYNKFENGGIFISDEIDSNFHPSLLQKIISLFNNPSVNKANAQLLFTSHDTNLMSPEIMRRDQFYFTEKSATDSTLLYSLADLKGIRNNADFARQYLAGYYGALPVLGNFIEEPSTIEK